MKSHCLVLTVAVNRDKRYYYKEHINQENIVILFYDQLFEWTPQLKWGLGTKGTSGPRHQSPEHLGEGTDNGWFIPPGPPAGLPVLPRGLGKASELYSWGHLGPGVQEFKTSPPNSFIDLLPPGTPKHRPWVRPHLDFWHKPSPM